jgi:hypothetical protein
MKMNQKGQSFEAYRVLIAAVIAIAVLVIIMGVIQYFDTLRNKVSLDTINASWKSAVDSPNGKIIRVSDLSFTIDTVFSRPQFSKQVNLEPECIAFDAERAAGYYLVDDDPEKPHVKVVSNVLGNVFMQCDSENFIGTSDSAACYAYCLISFGKPVVN